MIRCRFMSTTFIDPFDNTGPGGEELDFERKIVEQLRLWLPRIMVVAIDGWARSGKNTAGETICKALNGVLVDSGRFYRAATKACMNGNVNLESEDAVSQFCQSAVLDIRLRRESGQATEVEIAVNGCWFTKEELSPLNLEVSKVARVRTVRDTVNEALHKTERKGRVVMLGRDIGSVVCPKTPFKFFLYAPEEVREQRHLASNGKPGAIERDLMDQEHVQASENAQKINTGLFPPHQVRYIILFDLWVWLLSQVDHRHPVNHSVAWGIEPRKVLKK